MACVYLRRLNRMVWLGMQFIGQRLTDWCGEPQCLPVVGLKAIYMSTKVTTEPLKNHSQGFVFPKGSRLSAKLRRGFA